MELEELERTGGNPPAVKSCCLPVLSGTRSRHDGHLGAVEYAPEHDWDRWSPYQSNPRNLSEFREM